MSSGQHGWTEEDDKTLMKMWRANCGIEEIAKRFDISEREAKDRMHKHVCRTSGTAAADSSTRA
jgi:hypothetical protein